jgi:hypothetical protein
MQAIAHMSNEEAGGAQTDAYAVFVENMKVATSFLEIAIGKELRTEVRSLRPLAILRDEFGPFRRLIKDYTDNVYSVGLPQTVVFSVSCFEAFLEGLYETLRGESLVGEKDHGFPNLDRVRGKFGEICKADCLKGDDALQKRVKAVLEKRNIIVHRAGMIDRKAHDAFVAAGLLGLEEGAKLVLRVDDVKEDVEALKLYAATLVEATKPQQGLGQRQV